MARIRGGSFLMGSDSFYPEERPAHAATVGDFWIDRNPVTNAAFARFVDATGFVTCAQRTPDPAEYPDADPALLVPGSLVFTRTPGPVDLRDHRAWWRYLPGASWRCPEGPGSSLDGRWNHPVVHVAHGDAVAFADWAGKELPTEAEWEYAAQGGREGTTYAWGDQLFPDDQPMANTWQGRFPWENLGLDGYEGTSPVGAFPANGYGLHDMIGNVWEWTADRFTQHPTTPPRSCCAPHKPAGHASRDAVPAESATRVVKGGSHLCAPSYCLRYRPAARQPQTVDSSTTHLGFRCVLRTPA